MKVSVIVPIYSVQAYLPQCIDSLINQTYKNIEIILVDDGSKDECPAICDRYAEVDPRIKVIHKANEGLTSARKAGIISASGDYVMIVDGDDWMDLSTVAECIDVIQTHDKIECVMFGYCKEYAGRTEEVHIVNDNDVTTENLKVNYVYRRLYGLIGNELQYPTKMEVFASCCMKLYKRELLNNARYYDTDDVGSGEDALLNMYALRNCKGFFYIDKPFYHYRKSGTTITSAYRSRLPTQWHTLFGCMKQAYMDNNADEECLLALNNRIVWSFISICLNELQNPAEKMKKTLGILKNYVSTSQYREAVSVAEVNAFPMSWKVVLWSAAHKMVFVPYCIIKTVFLIRKMR